MSFTVTQLAHKAIAPYTIVNNSEARIQSFFEVKNDEHNPKERVVSSFLKLLPGVNYVNTALWDMFFESQECLRDKCEAQLLVVLSKVEAPSDRKEVPKVRKDDKSPDALETLKGFDTRTALDMVKSTMVVGTLETWLEDCDHSKTVQKAIADQIKLLGAES